MDSKIKLRRGSTSLSISRKGKKITLFICLHQRFPTFLRSRTPLSPCWELMVYIFHIWCRFPLPFYAKWKCANVQYLGKKPSNFINIQFQNSKCVIMSAIFFAICHICFPYAKYCRPKMLLILFTLCLISGSRIKESAANWSQWFHLKSQ